MASNQKTYNDIASILSLTNNQKELNNTIKLNKIDWDNLVFVSSQHLVLPAVFCRLKQKGIEHLLPKDLFEYLNEITSINRNRNKSLLNEAILISELFKKNNINHVFLKGLAFLAENLYEDLGERMITDIDVLVHTNNLELATKLLIESGYNPNQSTIGERHLNKRHKPRLINETKLAAVELHTDLINNNDSNLITPNDTLNNKQIKQLAIPSYLYLLKHNILNFQINDKGYYYNDFGFKSAYDSLILLKNVDVLEINDLFKEKVYRNYFSLLTIFFPEIKIRNHRIGVKVFQKTFLFKLKNPIIKKLWYRFLKFINYGYIISTRCVLFIRNGPYRKEIIKKFIK